MVASIVFRLSDTTRVTVSRVFGKCCCVIIRRCHGEYCIKVLSYRTLYSGVVVASVVFRGCRDKCCI